MKRWTLWLFLMGCCCAGCTDSPVTPTRPPTTTIAQVGGVWIGTVTQASAIGGECAPVFALSNGASGGITVAITQSGTTLSATSTSQATGQSCTYSGTAGISAVSLNMTSCNPAGYNMTCSGGSRDVFLITRGVTGTVFGGSLSGTTGDTWNTYPHNSTAVIAGFTVGNTFTLTRQ